MKNCIGCRIAVECSNPVWFKPVSSLDKWAIGGDRGRILGSFRPVSRIFKISERNSRLTLYHRRGTEQPVRIIRYNRVDLITARLSIRQLKSGLSKHLDYQTRLFVTLIQNLNKSTGPRSALFSSWMAAGRGQDYGKNQIH